MTQFLCDHNQKSKVEDLSTKMLDKSHKSWKPKISRGKIDQKNWKSLIKLAEIKNASCAIVHRFGGHNIQSIFWPILGFWPYVVKKLCFVKICNENFDVFPSKSAFGLLSEVCPEYL